MNSLRMAILTVAMAAMAAGAQETAETDRTHLLRNKFAEGETSYLALAIVTNVTANAGPVNAPIRNEMEVLIRFRTDDVRDNGEADISMGVEKMLARGEMPGMDNPQDLRRLLGLEDVTLTMTVNEVGDVLKAPSLPMETPGMENLEKGPNKMTEKLPWLQLPDEAIAIGGHWNHAREVPLTAASDPIISHTTYTLREVNGTDAGRVALIATESRIRAENVEVDPASMGMNTGMMQLKLTFKKYHYDSEGWFRFNLDEGRIESMEERGILEQEIDSNLNISGAGFPATMKYDYNIVTTGEFLESLPAGEPAPAEEEGE